MNEMFDEVVIIPDNDHNYEGYNTCAITGAVYGLNRERKSKVLGTIHDSISINPNGSRGIQIDFENMGDTNAPCVRIWEANRRKLDVMYNSATVCITIV